MADPVNLDYAAALEALDRLTPPILASVDSLADLDNDAADIWATSEFVTWVQAAATDVQLAAASLWVLLHLATIDREPRQLRAMVAAMRTFLESRGPDA